MYHYSAYKIIDIETLSMVIADYPLGLVISANRGRVVTTHIPLLLKRTEAGTLKFIGHMDKNNPQLDDLDGSEVSVVFSGPDSYISPSDYATMQLPTWNYIRVHARGRASVTAPGDDILDDIEELVAHLEPKENPWKVDRANERVRQLAALISRVEIAVSELEGRFKLSQEKSEADRRGALHRLLAGLTKKQISGIKKLSLHGL